MANPPHEKTLIIAGGGTGGHVLAGVAVADAWKEQGGPDAKVIFVGAQGGIEERLVPRAGYPLELLKIGSLNRVSFSKKIKTALQLPFSLLRSLSIIISVRPAAVLGVGGYASGPLVLMARLFSKTAVLEQNSVPGLTNRILGKITHRIFCAFPGTEKQFPASRALVTGNPIRSSMKHLPSASRVPFTIFIFGGSQGAMGINTLVIEALPLLGDLKQHLSFIHQTGEKDHERVLKAHQSAGTKARVEKFIYEMPQAYAEASILICRAGSSTLSEIAAVGRAAILVPLPTAADHHQEKNARIFTDAGAARFLNQTESGGEELAKAIRQCYEEPSLVDSMEKSVVQFYKPNAAKDIARALLDFSC